MADKKAATGHALIIEVKRTFPMQNIKEVFIKVPGESYGNTIHLTNEQAIYLQGALSQILVNQEETKK